MVSSTLAPKTPNAAAVEDLVLRVCGSSRDGQIVRLTSPKCTVGSAAQCTLRLRSHSVGRVHCLIVRGPNGTVVRRWSPDTRLNGGLFSDALLTPGDRLSVGGIDLEVLATGELPDRLKVKPVERTQEHPAEEHSAALAALQEREQAWDAKRVEAERQLRQQSEQLQARVAELDAQRHQLDADRNELDGERQRLEAERRACESQREQWQAERAAAEQQLRQQSEQPTARAAELDARATILDTHAAELAAQSKELDLRTTALDARFAELEARSASLDSRAAELASRTADVESRTAELGARAEELDRRAAELEASETRIASDQADLEKDREAWETERAKREAELARRAEELDARTAEPRAEVEVFQEPEFEAPKEEAPVDLAAVFRKIGAKPVLPEDEAEEPAPAKYPVRGKVGVDEPTSARPAMQPKPSEPKGDDESIDDYMAQLLQRMRSPGGQASTSPLRPAAAPSRTPAATAQSAEPETPSSESPQSLPPGRRKPAQMSPMTVAPEKQGGFSAMRELANMSAKTALHRHARGQTKIAARGKLLVTAIGLLVGGLLLWLCLYWHAGPLAFYAAMAGFVVSAVWGVQYAFLTGHLIVNKGRIKWEAKPVKKSETIPAEAVVENVSDSADSAPGERSETVESGEPTDSSASRD